MNDTPLLDSLIEGETPVLREGVLLYAPTHSLDA